MNICTDRFAVMPRRVNARHDLMRPNRNGCLQVAVGSGTQTLGSENSQWTGRRLFDLQLGPVLTSVVRYRTDNAPGLTMFLRGAKYA